MRDLQGRVAVVTGAAMGIGRCLAEALLAEGCRVALVDVNREALETAQRELQRAGGACRAYVCDVGAPQAVSGLASEVAHDLGPAALLVNNAGIVRAADLLELPDPEVEAMLRVNLLAHFWTCKAFLPGMIAQGEGHIVNIASAGGLLAIPSLTAYCASKFGVVGFTEALRQEMKKRRLPVEVTCVCPNTVNTGMFAGARMVRGTRPLEASDVSRRIVRAVKRNQPFLGIPALPVRLLTPLLKTLLPIPVMDRLNALLGMWHINDTWVGHRRESAP